jgi:carbamoyltransferase
MNILGINALGVAPSACIVQNGKMIAMAEEDRFTRFKGSFGFMPAKAVQFCLAYAGMRLSDIDSIAFSWDCNLYRFYMPYVFLRTYIRFAPKFQRSSNVFKSAEQLFQYQPGNVRYLLEKMFREAGFPGDLPKVFFVPHHLAHACASFYSSGFDSSYILVLGGSGEYRTTTILKAHGNDIRYVSGFTVPNSLGWFYQSITEFLGFLPNRHEGKVMALASYGTNDPPVSEKIERMLTLRSRGPYVHDARYSFLGTHSAGSVYSDEVVQLLGPARQRNESIAAKHKNIAFHAQDVLERASHNLVDSFASNADFNGKLCVTGGVALNCKMNGAIAGMKNVQELFVSPFPNDAGAALGAALYVTHKNGIDCRHKIEHSYWGPSFSAADVETTLIRCGASYTKEKNIQRRSAELLSQNKIVAWFQGRMEIGARALGNRSILANPAFSRSAEDVNAQAKNRELWRPFAPSILYEKRQNYLNSSRAAPFMAIAFRVTDAVKKQIPAVVHVDNTTRPHLVKKHINPRYWNLINEFEKITGVGAVLNTSFNTDEEPIVCTPEEALRTFYSSGIDYLAIDDFLVYKN